MCANRLSGRAAQSFDNHAEIVRAVNETTWPARHESRGAGLPHVERALDLLFFAAPATEDNGSLSGIGVFRRGALSSHERSEFLLRIDSSFN